VKVQKVSFNNRKRVFEVKARGRHFVFPYAKLQPPPSPEDKVAEASVDRELGREAFTYKLDSGEKGAVHIDHVLEYNEDPEYLRDLLLYKLTLEAQRRVKNSALSRREIIRRLGTSATQFYRLLDQKNYQKSIDQLLSLLRVLDCDVELVVKDRPSHNA